eukprot:5403066-Pyramimonas_sp.AAC.1
MDTKCFLGIPFAGNLAALGGSLYLCTTRRPLFYVRNSGSGPYGVSSDPPTYCKPLEETQFLPLVWGPTVSSSDHPMYRSSDVLSLNPNISTTRSVKHTTFPTWRC